MPSSYESGPFERAYKRLDVITTFVYVALVAAISTTIGFAVFNSPPPLDFTKFFPVPHTTHSAHVQVETGGGLGSAVHIGDGYFVTAAHVVKGQDAVKINTDTTSFTPEVLWVNEVYDIALMRLADGSEFQSLPLSCATPRIGDQATAHGNPMRLRDITTTIVVAGEPRTFGDSWKIGIPVDGVIAPGMSGGGVIANGRTVGINVGALVAPAGPFLSFYGLNVVVPGSVVCGLMGRS